MMDSDSDGATEAELKYYKDVRQCFVPSCKKYRRDFPNTEYFSIPKDLQATWCQALEMYCPKRNLYVCGNHINIEEDCYRKKTTKLYLKNTANLILTRTFDMAEMLMDNTTQNTLDDSEALPTTSTQESVFYHRMLCLKSDASTQTEIELLNKSVLVKPSVRSISCQANIAVNDERVIPSQSSSCTASGSSTPSLYEPSSQSSSSTPRDTITEERDLSGRAYMLKIIKEHPKMYLGIPMAYYWLLAFLAKECNLRLLHVIITLFKLKQNDTIRRMSHHFQLTQATLQELLKVSIPRLATYLQMHVYLPDPLTIKKTLPPAFEVRYANVQSILDCFEIQIEKASNPVMQSRTWSQYKSCNTLKYLIACCPNGFICFISRGIGGRVSDKVITERSGFVDILPPGAVVLADRGFKGIETLLAQNHVKLLRPPSVSSNETPTKMDVIRTKVIASLRIHVERVIRRLREFEFLKPHSVIHHNHVKYVDEAVLIACGLVNLQGNIIKIH